MTQAERKEVKAGKRERLRKVIDDLRAKQPKTMFDDQVTRGEAVELRHNRRFTPSHTQKRS